jgi:hypothetical protein
MLPFKLERAGVAHKPASPGGDAAEVSAVFYTPRVSKLPVFHSQTALATNQSFPCSLSRLSLMLHKCGAGPWLSLVRLPAHCLSPHTHFLSNTIRALHYNRRLEDRNIRLLRVELDTYRAPLRCHLIDASLDDDSLDFEALSYDWGDSGITEPIICSGEVVQVTVNLADALRRIRLGISPHMFVKQHNIKIYRPAALWVDAICINQTEISERNSQVQLMRDIYTKAKRVIVWLGDKRI